MEFLVISTIRGRDQPSDKSLLHIAENKNTQFIKYKWQKDKKKKKAT